MYILMFTNVEVMSDKIKHKGKTHRVSFHLAHPLIWGIDRSLIHFIEDFQLEQSHCDTRLSLVIKVDGQIMPQHSAVKPQFFDS